MLDSLIRGKKAFVPIANDKLPKTRNKSDTFQGKGVSTLSVLDAYSNADCTGGSVGR